MANNLPEYIISFGRGPERSGGGARLTSQATKGRLSCDFYMITEQKTIILDGELKIDQSEASDLQRRAEGPSITCKSAAAAQP